MRNWTSDLWIPSRSDALPLSHSNFTVSEVYYKVHMTCVPCTATINDVNSVMFVNKIREMVNFELDNELEKDIFRLFMSMRQRKNSKYLAYSRASQVWGSIPHARLLCLVAKPLNRSKTEVDLVRIQMLLLFKCKLLCLVSISIWSPSASLHVIGLATKYTTAKWPIVTIHDWMQGVTYINQSDVATL